MLAMAYGYDLRANINIKINMHLFNIYKYI